MPATSNLFSPIVVHGFHHYTITVGKVWTIHSYFKLFICCFFINTSPEQFCLFVTHFVMHRRKSINYRIVSLRRICSQKEYPTKTFVSKVTSYTLEKFKEELRQYSRRYPLKRFCKQKEFHWNSHD